MPTVQPPPTPSCVAPDVTPLIVELDEAVTLYRCAASDAGRHELESAVVATFHRSYGATVNSFYPDLLGFRGEGGVRAVVGYRDGTAAQLFSEQYLDVRAETSITRHLRRGVHRDQIVEVGNLALRESGHARWVIAATTVFLHAAGYRWVVFTAVRNLINAFQRLGLRPVVMAQADPQRLSDGGASWGRYYDAAPLVCAGDITAGLHKLGTSAALRQPRLRALLQTAQLMGASLRAGAPSADIGNA